MKKIVMASAVVAATAMAGDLGSRPEASVPTPVETRDAFDKVPKMSEKEKGDWLKMREERRAARAQILEDLRNKSAIEKNELRDVAVKPPVPEKIEEKNIETPKDDFVREKKMDEKELQKGPLGNLPFGPARMEPVRPFNPHERKNNPKVKPIKPIGWDKGIFPKK